jgi:hypothetical protein
MANHNEMEEHHSVFSVGIGFVSLTKKLTELTVELRTAPSLAFQAGDEVHSRGAIQKRDRSVWHLRSRGQFASDDLKEHLNWLLGKIEPYRGVIQRYIEDVEVEVVIRIDCRSEDAIGGISVRSTVMQQLSTLCNRIDVNFMGDLEADKLTKGL